MWVMPKSRARWSGSAGELVDAEGEAPMADPVAGEAHRDQAHSFQPVRQFQAADVQRAQPEALDECRHARLGLRIVASDEDIGPALLQDLTEDGVECLHHAGARRGHLGDFLRDRGLLAVGQSVERGVEGVADVDDDLAARASPYSATTGTTPSYNRAVMTM